MSSQYGRYRIVKELGKGTMGVVFQAHDPQIDRMVALKVLRPDRVTSEAFVARFLKEARAIGRLSHPNIVTIYDAGEDQGNIYLAMEYLKGEPFNEVLKSGRLSLPQAIEIARQVALTLDYAHRQGIVHRDIKPSNIIYTEEHQIKLTDFGIARVEDTGAGYQTQAGEILGTPAYMAPEQVMGQTVDGRSDLFSLGVVLYEMVVGHRPFSDGNIATIFRAITQDNPQPPIDVDPSIPKRLSDVILKSLAKGPEARFQTGREMAETLAAIQNDAEVRSSKNDKTASAGKRPIMIAMAAMLLVAAGMGGYFYVEHNQLHPVDSSIISNHSVTSNNENQNMPTTMPIPQQSPEQMAILKISSAPAGAQVYVDNELKGTTPVVVLLPMGKYGLRLNLSGYLEWEAPVELDVAGETPLHVSMRPKVAH